MFGDVYKVKQVSQDWEGQSPEEKLLGEGYSDVLAAVKVLLCVVAKQARSCSRASCLPFPHETRSGSKTVWVPSLPYYMCNYDTPCFLCDSRNILWWPLKGFLPSLLRNVRGLGVHVCIKSQSIEPCMHRYRQHNYNCIGRWLYLSREISSAYMQLVYLRVLCDIRAGYQLKALQCYCMLLVQVTYTPQCRCSSAVV